MIEYSSRLTESRDNELRWGIIGPGLIARHVAAAIARCRHNTVAAVASRDPRGKNLAAGFPGVRVHHGYESILRDEAVDVVYIATPHPFHAEWGVKAARAGKHVLCEKPIAMSRAEASDMVAAARRSGTFMGEAFMYRFHPLTRKLVSVLESGVIGEIAFLKSSFAFARPRDASTRRIFDRDLGGGGILDLGVYPVSMARLVAGAATGRTTAEPLEIAGMAHVGASGVDEWASALLRFPGDILAELSCGVSIQLDNRLRIFGSKGRVEVQDFWFCGGIDGGTAHIDVYPIESGEYSIAIPDEGRGLYDFEIEATSRAIAAGRQEFEPPGMSWADSLGNMEVVDAWLTAIARRQQSSAP